MLNNEMLEELRQLILNRDANWLSISGCVKYSTLSDSTIRRSIMKGSLRASKVGGKWLIKESWLEKYLTNG